MHQGEVATALSGYSCCPCGDGGRFESVRCVLVEIITLVSKWSACLAGDASTALKAVGAARPGVRFRHHSANLLTYSNLNRIVRSVDQRVYAGCIGAIPIVSSYLGE